MTKTKVAMPQSDGNLVPTLNCMGWMTTFLDEYAKAFIDFAATRDGEFLEIGAAYGIVSIEVLKKGRRIIANDLDERHLTILSERVPPDLLPNLTVVPGAFPDGIPLVENCVDAVFASRVLHFLDGPGLVEALKQVFRWLRPGGKIFLVADTPFLKVHKDHLTKVYLKRVEDGVEWPGFFNDFRSYIQSAASREQLPNNMHFLDPVTIQLALEKAGFSIEKVGFVDRLDYPPRLKLDGRENVGAIASK